MARLLSLLAVFGAAVLVFGSAPAGALPLGGLGFKPLSPVRLLDTRAGYQTVDTLEAGAGALGQGESRVVRVGGRGGVPLSGVAAVVLNLTAAEATAATFLTAYAAGGARPVASTLNPVPGEVSSNVTVVPVSAAGEIAMFNYVGRVEVIADVEGWFPVGGVFRPVAPARLTDTRPGHSTIDGRDAGGGPLGAGVTHDVQVAGRAGVPTVGVGAVVVNVTAVNVSAATYVTAFPAGTARPVASLSNPVPGGPTPAMAVVALSAAGRLSLFNFAGSADVVVDVVGWLPSGAGFTGLSPARLLDTRAGGVTVDGLRSGEGVLGASSSMTLKVTGRGGVPVRGVGAVVVNVTTVDASADSFVSVFPGGSVRPVASAVNPLAGRVVANGVFVKVNGDGEITIFNHAGAVHVVVDVTGWFPLTDGPSSATTASAAAGAVTHSCALVGAGGVWCWGANDFGELGDADTSAAGSTVPVAVDGVDTAVSVATGRGHSCALGVDGLVSCWGLNAAGQLGDGDVTLTNSVRAVPVTGLADVRAIAAGAEHTCALVGDGSVWCWGYGAAGQLGDGDVSLASKVRPVRVLLPVVAAGVAAGGEHSCAWTAAGEVWCWGGNRAGQLGDGTTTLTPVPVRASGVAGVVQVAAGDEHTCAVDATGAVWCWGANGSGQLGDATTVGRPVATRVSGLVGAVAVAAGGLHTCALLTDASVACWGAGSSGQLGDGSLQAAVRAVPAAVAGIAGAVGVTAGAAHSCAALGDGSVWCWGSNGDGQLGDGSTLTAAAPVEVAGL